MFGKRAPPAVEHAPGSYAAVHEKFARYHQVPGNQNAHAFTLLLGLLGTVTGMLATFAALGQGSGGDQAMAAISAGISEALITTETGLIIALPGLFFQYQMTRGYERYRAFLAQLESGCNQFVHRRRSSRRAA